MSEPVCSGSYLADRPAQTAAIGIAPEPSLSLRIAFTVASLVMNIAFLRYGSLSAWYRSIMLSIVIDAVVVVTPTSAVLITPVGLPVPLPLMKASSSARPIQRANSLAI